MFGSYATMQTSGQSQNSVEAVVSQLATLTAKGESFEFFIPELLTLGGYAVPEAMAKAVIVARVLSMGYEPDGFTQAQGGRVFRFRPKA